MQKNYLTYKTAALISLGICLILHLFFILHLQFRGGEILEHRPPVNSSLAKMVYGFTANFLLLFALYSFNFRMLQSKLRPAWRITGIILGSVCGGMVLSGALLHLQFFIFGFPENFVFRPVFRGLSRDLFLSVIAIFTSQILWLSQRRQQIALRYEALEAENMRTRYESLKNQVDPHFFFNTLSTLDSLVGSDPGRAREYIQQFSSVFRYTLQNKEVITLHEELDFTRNYCSLMQLRYGDNLAIHIETEACFDHYLVVPLGIQTLVENAIKHNIVSQKHPLAIRIDCSDAGWLSVSNNYQPKSEPEPGAGVGLSNLAERYRLKWQQEIVIRQTDRQFCVSLPLIDPA